MALQRGRRKLLQSLKTGSVLGRMLVSLRPGKEPPDADVTVVSSPTSFGMCGISLDIAMPTELASLQI